MIKDEIKSFKPGEEITFGEVSEIIYQKATITKMVEIMPVKSSEIKIIDYGKSMHFHDNLTVLKIGIDEKSMTSVMNKFDLSMRDGVAQLIHVHSPILAHIENRKKLKRSIKEPKLNAPGQVTAYSQGDYLLIQRTTTLIMKEHCAVKFEH